MVTTTRAIAATVMLLAATAPGLFAQVLDGPSFLPGDMSTPGESIGDQEDVFIAAGGSGFLVVWTDMRTSLPVYDGFGNDQSGRDVYAARLDASGNLIDTTPIVLSQNFGIQQEPEVAWNGQNWLVIWENETPSQTGGAPPREIFGVRISPGGVVLDNPPLVILRTPGYAGSMTQIAVAANGTEWLVVGQADSGGGLGGVRVAADGTVIDTTPVMLLPDTYFRYFGVDIQVAQGEYLLIYDGEFAREGRRFASDLTQIAPPFFLPDSAARVGSNGTDYFVTWDPSGGTLLGSRMALDGTLLDPAGISIMGSFWAGWFQGDRFQVKLINLDNHTHYFRNVDFGGRLHDDIVGCCGAGSHSFEVVNFKPTYGAPKVAEMQWRAGWGFRPHFDVIQQQDVFARIEDQQILETFLDGNPHRGWQYSAEMRGGDFRFNPPPFIITSVEDPSPNPLREADGSAGLVIGQLTEGYGVAKMCSETEFPLGGFCARDISAFNPHGIVNLDTDGDMVNDALWFPPFLRNPNPAGGDIIPPTAAWKPFLWINPNNGTLFIDPADPSQGYWAHLAFAHGAPIPAAGSITASLESPRAAAQVFYQFDDLFHDNAIFSPHPTMAT